MNNRIERGRAAASELASRLRTLAEVLPQSEQGLLLAFLERRASDRYRGWAQDARDPTLAEGLRACADREAEIARIVEGLVAPQREPEAFLAPLIPELKSIYEASYGGKSRLDQFATQAAAERVGARTWRDFAASEEDGERRAAFEECARLEEASAIFLEGFVDATGGSKDDPVNRDPALPR